MRDWLEKMTGKKFTVAAVIAIPGYYVTERHLGPVRVANPKNLPRVLVGKGSVVLAQADIDLVRRQLEAKCRDVEY
jgi:hypothetical protein